IDGVGASKLRRERLGDEHERTVEQASSKDELAASDVVGLAPEGALGLRNTDAGREAHAGDEVVAFTAVDGANHAAGRRGDGAQCLGEGTRALAGRNDDSRRGASQLEQLRGELLRPTNHAW